MHRMNEITSRLAPALALMTAALIAVAGACSDGGATGPIDGGGSTNVASVRFTPAIRSLLAWESIPMTLTITDASGRPVTGRPVSWESRHEHVATVSPEGVVTGVAPGTATIRATVDGKHGTATVHVSWPPVAAVTLDAQDVSLDEGGTRQLVATPRDAQGRALPGLFVGFVSSDAGIARVDALGHVTAVRPGTARITVTAHGKSTEAVVTVTADHAYDLLYQSHDGSTTSIWQLDMRDAAGVPTRLFPGRDGANAVPSPDGSRIAFLSGGIDAGIWIANRDGSELRELVIGSRWSPVYQPAWSPDGTKLAFTRRPDQQPEQIWIVDVATGVALVTTNDHPGGQSWPTWSPLPIDGSHRIAYAQLEGGRQQIWTMREDGTDRRPVTTGDVFDSQPAWSPDGQTIALQRLTVSHFDIWLVDAAGGNERGLVGIHFAGTQNTPAWSPDGKFIAFASRHETYGQEGSINQIYTVRVNDGLLARRTSGEGDKLLPTWIARELTAPAPAAAP